MTTLRIKNPANSELIKEIEEDSQETIYDNFFQAKEAQKEWSQTSLTHRKNILSKFSTLLEKSINEGALTLSTEMGKPITQSRNEIKSTPARISFFLKNIDRIFTVEKAQDAPVPFVEELSYEPLGVVTCISAWNYPYFVGSNVFVPALLAGNAVLYKPSEYATLTGLHIANLLSEAGLPANVFNPILGGPETGKNLLECHTDGVYFTGSHPTGIAIASKTAPHLSRLQLELGGKDPVYVCDDVDIKATAAAVADGAFYNAGQSCCAVERVYIQQQVYEPFLEAFLETVKGMRMGDPLDPKTYIGPLARPSHRATLRAQVEDAVAKGASIHCGGMELAGPGNYFPPTVFTEVNHEMLLMKEETFGPLIGLQKVTSEDEAIRLMNDTTYGLTAGVYTKSETRARRVLSQIRSGSVYWNCCDRVSPRLPWTGRNQSGVGATLGLLGLYAFVAPKAWHLKFPESAN